MAEKFIDIEKIIADKNPRLLKWMPRFVLRYLKRILHEDEVNAGIEANKDNYGYDFCVNIIERFQIKVAVEGLENIPKTGGAIFACNHPLGGFDALAIVQEAHFVRPDIKFVVNDILLNINSLKGMFVGVNKHGTNTKESLEDLNKLFESEQAVFVFPAGLVSRKKKGKVEDLEWKKTFVTRSKKFRRDVIPVYIDGRLSNWFYGLANFRKFIGIKANIEMLYLVDELFQQRNKTITVKFGKPIPHAAFDKSKSDPEWAEWVKAKVYEMR
ncbi:MAG: 1-acyl-sn-glycerol-3-phosphate acyltransferase [Bacteroidetes bacterium]|nr:1-acyl-sn-glycerol-3-phosphate acyltransferase [Bacteroidota bacterium]